MNNSRKKVTSIPSSATKRLNQDYLRLKKDPIPYITAEPLPSNILEWHYCIKGPPETPYCGGYYHGKLVFPREFPFKPPAIYMLTPSGRFKCNVRLCLSISDFHPDTWNPSWSVSTIITGLLSFMCENTPTMGSVEASTGHRVTLASKSAIYNLKNQVFCELFPDIVAEINEKTNLQSKSKIHQCNDEKEKHKDINNISNINNENGNVIENEESGISTIFVLIGVALFAYIINCAVRLEEY